MLRGQAGASAVLCLTFALARAQGAVDVVNLAATVNGNPSPARLVQIHFTGSMGNSSFSIAEPVFAGQINWNQASGTDSSGSLLTEMPLSFSGTGSFSAYCIDVTQDVDVNTAYVYTGLTDNLSAEPLIASGSGYSGMGSVAATAVQNLYAEQYALVGSGQPIQYDSNSADVDNNANDQSAAFQIALWDIIYGTNATPSSVDVTSSSNTFWISNNNGLSSFSKVAGMADLFVEAALTGPDQSFSPGLLALSDPTLPDMLVVESPQGSQSPPLPTPASGTMAASLMVAMAIVRRRRSGAITLPAHPR